MFVAVKNKFSRQGHRQLRLVYVLVDRNEHYFVFMYVNANTETTDTVAASLLCRLCLQQLVRQIRHAKFRRKRCYNSKEG